MSNRKLFVYKGPIMIDDSCVTEEWDSEVSAFDKTDAYNQFVMKVKIMNIEDLASRKVTLPGRLIEVKL